MTPHSLDPDAEFMARTVAVLALAAAVAAAAAGWLSAHFRTARDRLGRPSPADHPAADTYWQVAPGRWPEPQAGRGPSPPDDEGPGGRRGLQGSAR